jgi:hypothetical protein
LKLFWFFGQFFKAIKNGISKLQNILTYWQMESFSSFYKNQNISNFLYMKISYIAGTKVKTGYTSETPYVSQKWASVKIICEFPLHQMWSITPDVTVKIGQSEGRFSSY